LAVRRRVASGLVVLLLVSQHAGQAQARHRLVFGLAGVAITQPSVVKAASAWPFSNCMPSVACCVQAVREALLCR
jgi:hypothetical protein